jgi:predicted nucleotidyltransferase
MRTLDDVPLAPAERQAIEAAAAALHARFPVTDIVLYGFKARGDSSPDSDIDLLVLTARKLAWQEERTIIHELFDIGMRFDVLFSPLTAEAQSWREGLHSVLPIHIEVEREGVRCGVRGDELPRRLEATTLTSGSVVGRIKGGSGEASRGRVVANGRRGAGERTFGTGCRAVRLCG